MTESENEIKLRSSAFGITNTVAHEGHAGTLDQSPASFENPDGLACGAQWSLVGGKAAWQPRCFR